MAILFAGKTLLLSDPDGVAEAFINRYWNLPSNQFSAPPRVTDANSQCQPLNWPPRPTLKPNQLYMPSGATRWSTFFGLASEETKDAILSTMGRVASAELAIKTAESQLVIDSAEFFDTSFDMYQALLHRMYLLPPVPVSTYVESTSSDPSADRLGSLWIIPLVDSRYWWQSKVFVSESTTWTGLIEEIQDAIGEVVLGDALVGENGISINQWYGIPDPCYFRNGPINAAAALDLVCWSLNLRLVPFEGGYALRSKETAEQLFTAYSLTINANDPATNDINSRTCAGGRFDPYYGDGPNSITFKFVNSSNQIDYESVVTALDASVIADLLNLGDPAEFTCPAVVVPDSDLDADTDPDNKALLDLIALQWSQDFYKWTENRFSISFNQAFEWRFTGYEDYCLIDLSRRRGGKYVAITRVESLPMNVGYDYVPIQLEGNEDRNCCCGGTGETEILHAIPRICYGEGVYDVEIATYYPEMPFDDGSGQYSGSGDEFAEPFCGACKSAEGNHFGMCVGTGEIVKAIDVGKVPLVTLRSGNARNAHCLIAKVKNTKPFDTEIASGSGSGIGGLGSGSGSGSGSGAIPYMILSGTRYMVKIPWEDWQCCEIDGQRTIKLIQRKTYLVEGVECYDEIGDCENPLVPLEPV